MNSSWEELGDISQVIQSFSFNTVRYLVRSKIPSCKYDQDMKTFSSCETASNFIMDFDVRFCSDHYTETIIRSTGWSWCFQALEELHGIWKAWAGCLTADEAHWWYPEWEPGSLKAYTVAPLLVTPPLGRTSPGPAKCIKLPISL